MYQEFINDRLNVINILQKLEIIDIYFSQYKNQLDNFNDNNSLDKKILNKKRNLDLNGSN